MNGKEKKTQKNLSRIPMQGEEFPSVLLFKKEILKYNRKLNKNR